MTEKTNYRCVPSLQQFYSGGAVTLSSDGTFLACACNEKITIVKFIDASIKATLEGDSELVTSLAISPDDRFLFSASHSRLIRVWDLESFKCIRSWKGHEGPVMVMACHSSGGLLATGGADRTVQVWDVDGGFCTHFFKGHKGIITSMIFHSDPNIQHLVSGSEDATVRVWDLNKKKCISVLDKHFSAVTSLAISVDTHVLLTSGRDKVVNLWNLKNYTFTMTVPTFEMVETVCIVTPGSNLAACVTSNELCTDPTPTYFLTAGERGIVRIWSSQGGACLYKQKTSDATICSDEEESRRGFIYSVVLPKNHGLLCVTSDQQFLYYNSTQDAEGTFQLNLHRRLVGYNEEIVDLKFLDEEENFLAVATNLEQIRVYDLSSMSCSYVLVGHTDIVLCLDTCASIHGATLVVTGSKDNNVRLWDTETRNCIGIGTGHTGAVGAVAFSKKTRNFFVSGSSDRTLKIWTLDGLPEDGQQVNLKTRAVVAAHDKDINSLAVSPNDSLLCSGSQDRTACIWKLPNLSLVVTLKGHKRGIWSVEFSPVDPCVLTSSGDTTIKIWSISDGACLKTFEGHTSSVLRASFLSRGTQLVSSGADGLVKLWTARTAECVATYDKHDDKVWALAVGKKTEMLATGGGDAVINLWHDSTAADKEEVFRKEEEEVLRCQDMENAIADEDYVKAVKSAIELHRPHKLYKLFELLVSKGILDDTTKITFKTLEKGEILVLLEYIREWNTKIKFCEVALRIFLRIMTMYPPKKILEIKGAIEIIQGIVPYSQRHSTRIDRISRNIYILDYILHGMSKIEPDRSLLEYKNTKTNDVLPTTNNNEKSDLKISSKKRKSDMSGADEKSKDALPTTNNVEKLDIKISSKKRKSNMSGADKKSKDVLSTANNHEKSDKELVKKKKIKYVRC